MTERSSFRDAWPLWRFLAVALLAADTSYLAWYVHSLAIVAFWIALIAVNVAQLVWDWWRLPR